LGKTTSSPWRNWRGAGPLRDLSEAGFLLEFVLVDEEGFRDRVAPAQSIIELGYDLRKKTGLRRMGRIMLEYSSMGSGQCPEDVARLARSSRQVIYYREHSPTNHPYLSNDEGALFSVLDYCDVLSQVIFETPIQLSACRIL